MVAIQSAQASPDLGLVERRAEDARNEGRGRPDQSADIARRIGRSRPRAYFTTVDGSVVAPASSSPVVWQCSDGDRWVQPGGRIEPSRFPQLRPEYVQYNAESGINVDVLEFDEDGACNGSFQYDDMDPRE